MMLWVEMHGAGPASKAGVTNFDVAQYADDLPWLAGVTQVGGGVCGWAMGGRGVWVWWCRRVGFGVCGVWGVGWPGARVRVWDLPLRPCS